MHLLQISSLVLLRLVHGSVGATLADPFTASGNTWSDQTSITTKGSPGFFEATERWDLYRAPDYSVAISPATEADVVTAVGYPSNSISFDPKLMIYRSKQLKS